MSITEATLTAVLKVRGVPAQFLHDPVLRAVAYVLAALEEPTNEVERCFYDTETPLDPAAPGETPRPFTNRELLAEIHTARLFHRVNQLSTAYHQAEAG
ncbi:hypothetical protein [Arthrobacter sp. ISL-95]|uniref:hypothetical protein n=1 Tax=Arthrobacter sp. ISL-95 TaxID=2819116 RepID=UPI001BE65228|nr:hypothetical protein [Arthrobacter sp. ISL-95]MBT2586550.1 hypothetical protein [Arthrobacter sp. ISL-95]